MLALNFAVSMTAAENLAISRIPTMPSKSQALCSHSSVFACNQHAFLHSKEAFQKISRLFRTSFRSYFILGGDFKCCFCRNRPDDRASQYFQQGIPQRIIHLPNKELLRIFLVKIVPIGIHCRNDKLAHGFSVAAQNLVGSPGLWLVEIQAEFDIADVFSHCADDIPSGIRNPWQWRRCRHRR